MTLLHSSSTEKGFVAQQPDCTSGCGEEAPPYDALPLRDTLLAAREVIAELPLESRRELARRFEESRPNDGETTTIEPPREPEIDDIAWAADAAREVLGRDALVLGAVVPAEDTYVINPSNVDDTAPSEMPQEPLRLQGRPEATRELEATAL